jgi:excisionase family DNA binding protein
VAQKTMSTAEAGEILGCSAETIRRLVHTGVLTADDIGSKQRPRFRVQAASVRRHLTNHGRYETATAGLSARVAALEARAVPGTVAVGDIDGQVASLRARVADLEAAFEQVRRAAETQRAADDARGEAVRLLADAVGASERADALRRDAAVQLDEAMATFTRPPDPGPLYR